MCSCFTGLPNRFDQGDTQCQSFYSTEGGGETLAARHRPSSPGFLLTTPNSGTPDVERFSLPLLPPVLTLHAIYRVGGTWGRNESGALYVASYSHLTTPPLTKDTLEKGIGRPYSETDQYFFWPFHAA